MARRGAWAPRYLPVIAMPATPRTARPWAESPRHRAVLRYPEPDLRRALVVATLLAGGLTRASSTYPAEIRAHLGLNYTPDCTLCHSTPSGGFGTVTTPFGVSMRSRGLVAQ